MSMCEVFVLICETTREKHSGSYIMHSAVKCTLATIRQCSHSALGSHHSQHCCNSGNQ